MFREMRLQNFKAWRDTGPIRLAPITVFFGANSAGKTSLLQFLLMLKQTAESPDRRRVLHLGDSYSLADLGSFRDIAFRHSLERALEFSISWNMSKKKTYQDPTEQQKEISWSALEFNARISAEKGAPKVESFSYRLSEGEIPGVRVEVKQSSSSKYAIWLINNRGKPDLCREVEVTPVTNE